MSAQAQGRGKAARAARKAGDSAQGQGMRTAGRAGFVARGVVYLLVGYIAIRVAFGSGGGEADRQGALHQIAAQPFGTALLWILAAGFACMTLWRAAQAVFGSGSSGGKDKTGSRLLNAGRAVFYASVCWGTAAYAAGSGGSSGSDQKSKDWTASALKLPAGRWLVGIVGVGFVAVGVGLAVRAGMRKFLKKLETARMSPPVRKSVTATGVAGGIARGAVFAGAGVFVIVAAVRFDPGKAKGMDDTLRSFAHTPAGPWLLVLTAVGLALFGLFSFASARWRRF
ncbi:DUF1206 domain-containing protein [Streptomyces sp. CA-111067]|uniref:DUF1206 domain-containing protein n=1 Tax=Streptomyces sp. CA-111067 TaxID=3240046 RepID=UPI003D9781DB